VPKRSKHHSNIRRPSLRPTYDPQLETGLTFMREGDSLAAAARKIAVTPGRLRRYVTGTGVVERKDGAWLFKRDRRFRRLAIYSDGRELVATVSHKTSTRVGAYMNAVKQFLSTEDISLLAPFQGESVTDVKRKRYALETRPNVLFRLDAAGVEPFELVYAIVKPE
jgi:hypothetical protein